MSGHYKKLGIEFRYPENWLLLDEETKAWPRSVTVQNSEGAFWSLVVYDDADPSELTQQVRQAMDAEYEDIDVSDETQEFGEFQTSGFDMSFYCLDFLVRSKALAGQAAGQTYLMIWQAEDREFDTLEPVFEAISTSLFASISQALARD